MDAEGELYHLGCSPATVCWGYMDPTVPPRLSVPEGARVRVDCVNGGPEVVPTEPPRESLGATEWHIPPELAEIHAQVTERVNPGHILTGPVYVEGAEPGDVLRVDIEAIDLRTNWAWTASRPYGGALANTEPAHLRHTLLVPSTSAALPGSGWAFPQWGGRLGEHHVVLQVLLVFLQITSHLFGTYFALHSDQICSPFLELSVSRHPQR